MSSMSGPRLLSVLAMFSIGCFPIPSSAVVNGACKVPHEVHTKLAAGKPQDLIVVVDDAEIQAQAARLNATKGAISDDNETLRFKAERYSAIKQNVILTLPVGEFKVLQNYDALPLMYLRIKSPAALKALLAAPSVLKAFEDRQENLLPEKPTP